MASQAHASVTLVSIAPANTSWPSVSIVSGRKLSSPSRRRARYSTWCATPDGDITWERARRYDNIFKRFEGE